MRARYLHVLLALSCLLALSSCVFVRGVDRDGVVLVRRSHPAMVKYGADTFEAHKKKYQISHEAKYVEPVARVSERLKQVIVKPEADWEFVIFKDNSANAFALSGGKVGIHTGLFAIIEDDDPRRSDALLAAVLGHEIAHATANHAEGRMYRALIVGALGASLWYGLEESGEAHSEAGVVAFGLLSYLADSLPLSRRQEYESDQIGALYMAKAGYDPRESIELWRRLDKYHTAVGGKELEKPAFLRSHPTNPRRIAALEEFMPTALRYYRPDARHIESTK